MDREHKSAVPAAWNISSREMRDILNSTHDGMLAVDEKGIIILLNTAAERLLEISAAESYGRPAKEVIPGSRLHYVMESGLSELNQRQDIGTTCIVTNRVPVRDSGNRIVGAVAVFRDITEVEQLAEEITAMKEIKELLEAIINSTQDAISVVDHEGKIIMVNPAYSRVIGMRREEVLGKSPTVDIREGESVHLHVMKTLESVRGVPMRVGPGSREVLVNAAPIIVNSALRGSVAIIHDISEIKRLNAELAHMKSLVNRGQARYTFDNIVAKSPSMLIAVEHARRAAATPVTVLLSGESGTGKELFAHAIHHASPRKNRPFVRVNCAAIPVTLLESELFGYEGGAFSGALKSGKKGLFEEAGGGTIFLDEIGEIPPAVQVKLLRVLQEKEFTRVGGVKPVGADVRIIAATNQNLEDMVKTGAFREDLYYRINVYPISIPPLRQRPEELPELVRYLLDKLNQEYGRSVQGISGEALNLIREYHWPGNVRELENVLGRAIIHMGIFEDVVAPVHLPPLGKPMAGAEPVPADGAAAGRRTLAETVTEAERQAILAALAANDGNRAETARQLGIAIRSLYYKMERYGIKGL
ncbi:MAG TPA: sigma-54-dependent Fis family transcriptional regulator [Selenomonadales bacterium]|nr:sigma-54-dependent Fis family transcriptional regulator [Selenomonadales bacterium]